MGTSVLMSRVSSLDVTLRDEWKINRSSNGDAFMPTRRYIYVSIDFNKFDKCYIIIYIVIMYNNNNK